MDQAGRKGEALLPATGELAGELVATIGQAEAFEAALHGGAAVGEIVETRDEIEIFADTQVLVVTEFLRHVADMAFDVGLLRTHVVAEARAGTGVGGEQAAEHADEGGLAATVGAEEAVDFAAAYAEIDGVDDGLGAETLGDSGDVDREVGARGGGGGWGGHGDGGAAGGSERSLSAARRRVGPDGDRG